MEKLLQMAKKLCDKVEVYSQESTYNSVSFENAQLHDIDGTLQSGVALRIIKDGKLGFAYTRNLIDREEILENALASLEGKVEASYDFPLTTELRQLDTFDPSLQSVSSKQMVDECTRVCDLLKSRTDGEILFGASAQLTETRIINSEGTDVSIMGGEYGASGGVIFPGSGSAIWRVFQNKSFERMPDTMVNEMIELYKTSSRVVEPKGGRMKVLFMPNSMLTLSWRILSGTSSKNVYERVSPVAGKVGERIFGENVTIYDDPLDDRRPGARSFDDEGVACKPLTIVEKGVLKSFYYDLDYASKLKAKSTGHGYRTIISFGATDPVTQKPGPVLTHMRIQPGNKSFSQLVKAIDRGMIIDGALGPHSGNIPNGDYSVGVNPGLYVENGEIVGRVKDAMVAGNVYETLKDVIEVGDALHPSAWGAWVPAILCDNVSVATKN
ncbi:MAG: TldD/PmbA family protein [Candidatus Zixiibacteriota bacterium]